MPKFEYKASRKDGSQMTGEIEAEHQSEVLRQLRKSGLIPIHIQASVKPQVKSVVGKKKRARATKPGHAEILAFTRELSVLLTAGLPLDKALGALLGTEGGNPRMQQVINDILEAVKSGETFSQALKQRQALFGDFYINMIRSGEYGGHLAPVLKDLAEHLDRVKELKSSVVSALIYPAILVVVAVLSVFLMLGFVVPQFEALFEDMGDALPWPTELVVAMGDFVSARGWVLVVGVILFVYLWRQALQRNPGFRHWRDRKMLQLPILGDLVLKYETTQFARTAGTLLNNGVSVLDALRISMDTIGNSHIKQAMQEVIPSVKGGVRMAVILERTGVFSPVAVQMIRTGEESGGLAAMLLELARVYDQDVRSLIKRALTLVEPLLILVLGVMIAGIIIAILMGILSVNDLAV